MNNKVILVTGASSGLGKSIATHLAAQGYTVFGTSRKAMPAVDRVQMLELDVTDEASIKCAVAEVIERAGRIDVLINNAGSGLCGALEDTDIDEARWQMETNFFWAVSHDQGGAAAHAQPEAGAHHYREFAGRFGGPAVSGFLQRQQICH